MNYEYVYGTWTELMQALENKEIDFICTAQYTEERSQLYEFSAYPIGYTQGLLYTRDENEELCFEDFQAMDGMTVGVLHGNAMNELFMQYAQLHEFDYQTAEYATNEEMLEALDEDAVDAVVTESLAYQEKQKLLANIGADAYYIISYPENP